MAGPKTAALRKERGRRSEQLALDYLVARGLEPVATNYRCRMGEVDLVMLDGQCLVFVEVRYRRANRYASAAISVTRRKQRKLVSTASLFLVRHPGFRNHLVRFDVVAVDAANDAQCTIQWLKDAFRPEN